MPLTVTVEKKTSEDELTREVGKISGRTVYVIECSEPCTAGAAETAADDTGDLPGIGSSYPDIEETVPARKRTIRCTSPARDLYEVSIEYDDSNDYTVQEDPFDVPTAYEYQTETFEEPFFEEAEAWQRLPGVTTGPFVKRTARMTNGVPFATLPIRSSSVKAISITKNVEATKTMADYDGFREKTNASSVTIEGVTHSARTLLVTDISLSKTLTLNRIEYKTLSIKIKHKKSTWDQAYESLGVQDIDGKPIKDDESNPVAEPWPLTDAGERASDRSAAGAEIRLRPYETEADLSAIT